jgi:hypothetical protein
MKEDKEVDNGVLRKFETGATRDTSEGKLDYEGFLSPAVLRRYAEYLDKYRTQSDGVVRASDNWQKGIPPEVYMKSLCRHFFDVWEMHRGGEYPVTLETFEEALCGVMFNSMGYLFETLKEKQ